MQNVGPFIKDQLELLTVEEVFMIANLGLMVAPDFPVPNHSWSPSMENVTIVLPDATQVHAEAQFARSHFNITDPSVSLDRRWRVTVCILNIDKDNVPLGSRLFVRAELANQLRASQV